MTLLVRLPTERELLGLEAARRAENLVISDRGVEVNGIVTHEWASVISCEIEVSAESPLRLVLRGAWNWWQQWHDLALEITGSRKCFLRVVSAAPSGTTRYDCGRLAGDDREDDVARARADLHALVEARTG